MSERRDTMRHGYTACMGGVSVTRAMAGPKQGTITAGETIPRSKPRQSPRDAPPQRPVHGRGSRRRRASWGTAISSPMRRAGLRAVEVIADFHDMIRLLVGLSALGAVAALMLRGDGRRHKGRGRHNERRATTPRRPPEGLASVRHGNATRSCPTTARRRAPRQRPMFSRRMPQKSVARRFIGWAY